MIAQVALAVVIQSLAVLVIQWIPWTRYTGHELTTTQRNVARTLAIAIPWIVLLVIWNSWRELIALTLLVTTAGIVITIVTLFDDKTNAEGRASAAENAERILKERNVGIID